MKKTPWSLAVSMLLAAAPVVAGEPGRGPGHGHGPPPEAVTACANLAANAACSFTMGADRSVTGTCEPSPDGASLACRPSGPPPGHRGPPQEAVNACSGLSVNATCAFALGSTNLTGTCVAPPGDASGSLACRPDRMPPPPDGR